MTDGFVPHYLARSAHWRWDPQRPDECGGYRMGSVSAQVRDEGENAPVYLLEREGAVLIEGACFDFDQAIKAVEDKLVEIGWLAPAPYGEEITA